MKNKEFKNCLQETFGEVLGPHSFSCEKSKFGTFYRKKENIYHIILPDRSVSNSNYDIRVYVSSPLIDPLFHTHFPDELAIPSDLNSYLHPESGVSGNQKKYFCKHKEALKTNFNNVVKKALLDKALPFLDSIDTLESYIPYIRRPLFKGAALFHSGKIKEALSLLKSEKKRLESINDGDPLILAYIDFIDHLIQKT